MLTVNIHVFNTLLKVWIIMYSCDYYYLDFKIFANFTSWIWFWIFFIELFFYWHARNLTHWSCGDRFSYSEVDRGMTSSDFLLNQLLHLIFTPPSSWSSTVNHHCCLPFEGQWAKISPIGVSFLYIQLKTIKWDFQKRVAALFDVAIEKVNPLVYLFFQ